MAQFNYLIYVTRSQWVNLHQWILNLLSTISRDHSGYGLNQWNTTLECNIVSHWLNPHPEWSLIFYQGHYASNILVIFMFSYCVWESMAGDWLSFNAGIIDECGWSLKADILWCSPTSCWHYIYVTHMYVREMELGFREFFFFFFLLIQVLI